MWYTSCRMNQKLSPIQIQKQVLAPLMQKSVAILMLSSHELDTAIETELQDNPLLELDDTNRQPIPQHNKEEVTKIDFQRLSKIWEESIYTNTASDEDDEDEIRQNRFKRETTLEESLLRHLRIEFFNPFEIKVGEYIIGNLDEDGYLTVSCEEIAEKLRLEIAVVEQVLRVVQGFDPVGIASRNIQECLLIQIRYKNFKNQELLNRVILEHFVDLGRKKFTEIARKLSVSEEDVREAAKQIATLEPKPARNSRPIDSTIYVKPDVTIKKDAKGFQVIVNDEWMPPLRINRYYQGLLKRPNLTSQEREFIQGKLENAVNFIRSIKQRGETMVKIVRFILEKQISFFEDCHNPLVPLTLKEVAQSVERSESTVSRAIRNKFLDTPHGVYPLKFFFASALEATSQASGDISSRSIKEDLKELIEQENKTSPLSDQKIVAHFAQKGVKLARRTVAKYRLELEIPSSHLRKE